MVPKKRGGAFEARRNRYRCDLKKAWCMLHFGKSRIASNSCRRALAFDCCARSFRAIFEWPRFIPGTHFCVRSMMALRHATHQLPLVDLVGRACAGPNGRR